MLPGRRFNLKTSISRGKFWRESSRVIQARLSLADRAHYVSRKRKGEVNAAIEARWGKKIGSDFNTNCGVKHL